jgi:hypothetical protein
MLSRDQIIARLSQKAMLGNQGNALAAVVEELLREQREAIGSTVKAAEDHPSVPNVVLCTAPGVLDGLDDLNLGLIQELLEKTGEACRMVLERPATKVLHGPRVSLSYQIGEDDGKDERIALLDPADYTEYRVIDTPGEPAQLVEDEDESQEGPTDAEVAAANAMRTFAAWMLSYFGVEEPEEGLPEIPEDVKALFEAIRPKVIGPLEVGVSNVVDADTAARMTNSAREAVRVKVLDLLEEVKDRLNGPAVKAGINQAKEAVEKMVLVESAASD